MLLPKNIKLIANLIEQDKANNVHLVLFKLKFCYITP